MPLLVMACGMLSAQHNGKSKMSQWVRMIVAQEQNRATFAKSDNGEEPDKRMMTAFVLVGDGDADEILSKYGCRKFAQLDDIIVARIPLRCLSEMAQEPSVRRIEANQTGVLTTDTTAKIIGAQYCYEASEAHPAFTGDGVVVGVMDVGFDLTHPAFYDATRTRYRIGAVWDHLSKDTVGSPLPVGRDFVGEEAVLSHQYSTDTPIQQHGSHTVGIIAGGDAKYRGIAFDSEICLVSNAVGNDEQFIDENDYYMFSTATDAMGFKYIFDYADAKGKPCVVSFSEGYPPYLDGEDSLYSAFLGKLNAPGHVMLVSAGNENRSRTYMEKPIGTEAAGAFLNVSKNQALYRVKSTGPMQLKLYAYRDGSSTPTDMLQISSDDERMAGDGVIDTLFVDGDTCAVQVSRSSAQMVPEDIYYFVMKTNKKIPLLPPLALVAEGQGSRVEFFGSSTYAFKNAQTDERWNSAQNGHNVFAPGCFDPVICVGATTHRLSVLNYENKRIYMGTADEPGLRADYSSVGPSFNGLLKPEVMAPGTNVVSAFNSFYMEKNTSKDNCVHFSDFNEREYAWGINSGTSMATPVAAGTVALWLQADPTLTKDDVLDIIRVTSRKIDETATYPNTNDGYGEIQAHAGLIEVLRRKATGLDELSYTELRKVNVSIINHALSVILEQPSGAPFRLRVYALTGVLLLDEQLPAGQTEYKIALPAASHGVLAVQLNSSDQQLTGSKLVRN